MDERLRLDDRLKGRLEALKQEFAVGQGHLQEIKNQEMSLREMMLRISGAIQVLEELLNDEQAADEHTISVGDSLPVASQNKRTKEPSRP